MMIGDSDRRIEPKHWTLPDAAQRGLLWAVGLLVCILVYAYAFHMDREIFHDEPGLLNPIHTFLTTGRMTYPLHGQPEFMTVHPPTHYLVVAFLIEAGLSLFHAAGVPLVALAATLAIVVSTASMPLNVGFGLLLGLFCGSVVWADFYTVRPDLHLTFAWFTGLVALESARYRDWSRPRLLVGTTLSIYAATIHYWGVAAILTPIVYGIALVIGRGANRSFVKERLWAIATGGAIVGIPFLLLFVVPLWGPILQIVQSVQGTGGPGDALQRHLMAYSNLAQRLGPGFTDRPIVTLLTYPSLMWGIPAVIPGAVLCGLGFRSLPFAVAGAILPAFVLLGSQGKPTGHTFYLTPEITLLASGVIGSVLATLNVAGRRLRAPAGWMPFFAGSTIAVLCFAQIPNSMGSEWRFTRGLHDLELSRAAAFDVVGPGAVMGAVSLGPWFTGGGTFVWSAANELTEANRAGRDIQPYLRMVDFFVLDIDWWHALPDVAPLGTWYVGRKLDLFGFVLPQSRSGLRQMNLLVSARPVQRVQGYFVAPERADRFDEAPRGPYAFSVFACASPVPLEQFGEAFYRFSFFYDAPPSPQSKVLLLLGSRAAAVGLLARQAGASCTQRDSIRGTLTPVGNDTLVRSLRGRDQPIRIAETLGDVLAGAGAAEVGEPLDLAPAALEVQWAPANLPAKTPRAGNVLPLTIRPPDVPWGYGAVIPLRVDRPTEEPLLVRIRAHVRTGEAGFGIVNRKEDAFLTRAFRPASSQPSEINLLVVGGTEIGPLVIQNGGAGSDTHVVVEAIEAYVVSQSTSAEVTGTRSVK